MTVVREQTEPDRSTCFELSACSKILSELEDFKNPDNPFNLTAQDELGFDETNNFKSFSFMDGTQMPVELSNKMTEIDHVMDYLEGELGEANLKKLYPILKDFGDDILFVENSDLLC